MIDAVRQDDASIHSWRLETNEGLFEETPVAEPKRPQVDRFELQTHNHIEIFGIGGFGLIRRRRVRRLRRM